MSEGSPEINPEVGDWDLKYYIFDWDDNILHMPTRIHLERRGPDGVWRPVAVTTSVFSLVRNDRENYRPPDGDWESSFREFRDFAELEESTFLRDTRAALEPIRSGREQGAPSFFRFKKALVEGRLFAIVTARGHGPESIRAGVQYFIDEMLSAEERKTMLSNLRGFLAEFDELHVAETDDEVITYYLDLNRYHGVTSPQFMEAMQKKTNAENTEEAKQIAIKDFVHHVISILKRAGVDKPISFGFSDDDPGNVEAVESYIAERLGDEFPGVKFVVYDTSDPDMPQGRKVVVRGQQDLGL